MTQTSITIVDSASTATTGQGGQVIVTGTPTTSSVAYIYPEDIQAEVLNSFSATVMGTWTGTLRFETTVDGINYVPYDAMLVGIGTTLSTITANGTFKGNVAGVKTIRLRATATITGTAIVYINATAGTDVQHIEFDSSSAVIGTVSINQTNPGVTNGVTIVPANVTRFTGQVKIAVTGTAVQINATSYVMQNGVTITAGPNNTAPVFTAGGTGSTTGASNVTDGTDGTGNGNLIQPGATQSIGSGVNLNAIYVNGNAGDLFFYDAS